MSRSNPWKQRISAPALLVGTIIVLALIGTWIADRVAHGSGSIQRLGIQSRGHSPFEGKPAPGFTLPDIRTGEPVSLVDNHGHKPTVLIFGSFGCDLFCGQIDDVLRLHRQYKDQVRFLFVYVRDANHTNPELDDFLRARPAKDRSSRIRGGLGFYAIDMPCLLDGDDRQIERMYSAYPERLFIIDRAGMVYWDSTVILSEQGLCLSEGEARLRECLSSNDDKLSR
jgi:hypothetical protein